MLDPDFSASIPSDSTAGGQDPKLHLQWCLHYDIPAALPAGRQANQLQPSSDVSSHSDGRKLFKYLEPLAVPVLLKRRTLLLQFLFFDRTVIPHIF